MSKAKRDEPPQQQARQLGHEPLGSVRGVVIFAVVLAITLVLTMTIVGWMHSSMLRELRGQGADVDALPASTRGRLPSQPRLQISPSQDLRELRAREEQRLQGLGWVDRQQGRVHIPVEQAMREMASEGQPR